MMSRIRTSHVAHTICFVGVDRDSANKIHTYIIIIMIIYIHTYTHTHILVHVHTHILVHVHTHIYIHRHTNRQTHTYISPCDELVWTVMAPTVATRTHILPWLYRHTHANTHTCKHTYMHYTHTHTLYLSLTHTCTSPCVVLVLTVVAPTEATRFHASIANSYPETHMNESCSLRKFIS